MSAGSFPALGIPRWDQPLPEEHPAGLMLRLAQLNRFRSVTTVERETGIGMSDMKLGRGLERLAGLVGCTEERLVADAFRHRVGAGVTIRGQQISHKRDLSRILRRVCPCCLAESPQSRFWWDLTFLASCPRHGCLLEGRCGCASRTPLSWSDGRVGACRVCDEAGDPRPAAPTPAPAATLALDAYFLARLDAGTAPPLPILDALPLYDAVDVLERVGALSAGGYSIRWHTTRSLGIPWTDLLAEGYAVLSRGGLPGVLDRIFDGGSAAGAYQSLTSSYGWFYYWLNGKGGRAFSEELLRIVIDHAEVRFVVDKRARAALLPPSETCTFVEATKRCGVTQGVMRDILKQRGLLPRSRAPGQAYRFPEAEIREVEAVMRDSVPAYEAATLLGTTSTVVKGLTALGVLDAYVTGGRPTKHAHVYRRCDVQAILDRLVAGLPQRLVIDEDEISLTDAARLHGVLLAVLCQEALEGRLALSGRMATGGGLQGIVVRRDDVLVVWHRCRSQNDKRLFAVKID